jgi:hypothetical protein
MARDPKQVLIYHITHIDNLPGILKDGGLHSDAAMAARDPKLIGYTEIKKRRLNEIHVPCCGYHYVGDFVPFYFCPRSPRCSLPSIRETLVTRLDVREAFFIS